MAKTDKPAVDLGVVDEKSYDELACSAQHFLSERPVVVLGTGATIPHGLPSMEALANQLITTIKGNPPGWKEFSACLSKSKDLEQALHDVALPEATVEILVAKTWQIVASKDLEFYESLMKGLPVFPLAALFKYLLRTADAHIRVVTTNYDRVAEYAANYVNAYVSTGLTAGWIQKFVPAAVNHEYSPKPGYEGQVSLLKVHGSLDWFRDNSENIVGIPHAHSMPPNMKPLVVTPGVSKYREVHKDPFRTVMSSADEVLRSARCYVCIGYGFNDEHVQPILVNRVLKDDIPLVLVTKKLSHMTRTAFLKNPPKKFLFFEEAIGGTKVYNAKYPKGVCIKGLSAWQLEEFMKLISGEKVR